MGDGTMAFWNAPLDNPEHPRSACETALAIWRKLPELNAHWRGEATKAGRPHKEVKIGIGINTGQCCVGNLGSTQRFDYSAIGDEVNLTSRFEGLTKYYGVPTVVGEQTIRRVNGIGGLEIDQVRVKGRVAPSRIYTLTSLLDLEGDSSTFIQSHNELLEAYRQGAWEAAEAGLARCLEFQVSALSTIYRIYGERIAELRLRPLPANWDGVFTALEK
jgi:adenylate cyclase